jgi:glycosyltransferase involved in cell wall biosynthesis
MPEVAGDAAILVDPESVEAIRAGMRRLIDDSACVAGLVEAGYRNVRRFEPAAVAEAYAAVYRSVADRAGRRERADG